MTTVLHCLPPGRQQLLALRGRPAQTIRNLKKALAVTPKLGTVTGN